VPSASISYPAVQFVVIQILTPAGILQVQLHPSIVLDTSGAVPVLRVVSAPTLPPRRTEVFGPGAAYTTVTMSLPPDSREIRVYRNGLLMAPTIDYSIAAQVVTFTVQPTLAADIVQVSYGPLP